MSDTSGVTPELTPKEKESLRFIRAYVAQHGYAPSIPDVAREAGISFTVARGRSQALQRKGYVSRARHRARSLVLLRDETGVLLAPSLSA